MSEATPPPGSLWVIARYRPTAPFSLRTTTSTSSGGKTLFVPTPYAVKLALVDAAIRAGTVERGRAVFDILKAREVRLRPPEHLVVNNTFVKVWRARELKSVPKDPVEAQAAREALRRRPYQDTIAYREFCCFTGDLEVALEASGLDDAARGDLLDIMAHVNYYGKRGSFMQFLDGRDETQLPEGFSLPVDIWHANGGGALGTIQPLDDLGETQAVDLFERVNTYSDKRLELLKHRRLVYTAIPYRLLSSSRSYSRYKRIV
jgi:hypothetical protein